MLIDKGRNIVFQLEGRDLRLSNELRMLHDPMGDSWPRTSVLFAPIEEDGDPLEEDADVREYFGRGYVAQGGSVDLPAKNISSWKKVGLVQTIFYTRTGIRAPGKFRHQFQVPMGAGTFWGGLVAGVVGAFIAESKPVGFLIGAALGGAAGALLVKSEFPFDPPAALYSRRCLYRLELPRASWLSWRGYVIP